jgi:hypothetical protein
MPPPDELEQEWHLPLKEAGKKRRVDVEKTQNLLSSA